MNSKIKLLLLLAVITSVTALAQNGPDLLQKALRKERVDGDVKGAIELYQQIVKDHGANRPLAAQALVQIGKGFEKLGAVEARSAYEKVISEYADQTKEAAEAKERLKTLDGQGQPNGADGQPVIQKVMVPNSMGRPSPDGRYISFVNWDQGNLAIYDTKTGEKRDVTKEGHWGKESSEFCDQSFWSADGKQIAYGWFTGNKSDLRVIDCEGGKPRILVSYDKDGGISPKDWSPDGRYIVGLKFRGTDRIGKEIVLVEVSTGAIRLVKDLPGETYAWTVTVSFSPDGKYIAYDFPGLPRNTSDQQVQRQIRIVDADGSNDRVLIDHPANDWAPRWMPDGKHLLFVSDRSGTDGLWVVLMKQGDATTGQPRLVRDGLEARFYPMGFALNGTLYYNFIRPRRNVFVAGVDFEAASIQSPKQVSLRFDGRNQFPRWSADGSHLAYYSRRFPGFRSFLVFWETATGKERDVEIPLDWPEPQWSPDGARMVFGAWANARYSGLYTFDVQSGHCVLAVDKASATWGNFSRDGHHLVYLNTLGSGVEQGSQIIERNLQSGQERVIRSSRNRFNKMLLSPDGLRLAYVETNAISITAMGDGATKTVWESSSDEQFPELAWLSDSRRLLVATSAKEGTQQLHVVDTQTKSHRPVGEPLRGDDRIQHLTVHPDGSRIAFSRGSVTEEVWTMKNILPEEKRVATDGQTIIQELSLEKLDKRIGDPGTRPSPDGRYLSFINWSFGNLAVCDTKTGEVRDLTTEGTWEPPDQFCDSLVWSPDGRQIAYFWVIGERGDLRIIDRNGGRPRVVVPFDKGASIWPQHWSRDGLSIVGVAKSRAGDKWAFRIALVDVATGTLKVVKELPGATASFHLTVSPDGQHIVYGFPSGQLRAVGIDGSNDRVLIDQPASNRSPLWMSDGRHLLYLSDRSGTDALWALPMKGGEAAGGPLLVQDGLFSAGLMGCTDDGTLYYQTTTARANIFVADVDFEAGAMQTPRQVSLRFDGRSRHPRWSADGSTLTYVSRQFPGSKDATHVLLETSSGRERDLRIPAGGYWGPPQWSADHRTLYARGFLNDSNGYALYALDVQSSQPLLIADKDNAGSPTSRRTDTT